VRDETSPPVVGVVPVGVVTDTALPPDSTPTFRAEVVGSVGDSTLADSSDGLVTDELPVSAVLTTDTFSSGLVTWSTAEVTVPTVDPTTGRADSPPVDAVVPVDARALPMPEVAPVRVEPRPLAVLPAAVVVPPSRLEVPARVLPAV